MSNETQNEEVVTEAAVEDTPVVEEAPVESAVDPVDSVEALVEERLAKMKANMDRMASERDDALKMKAEMESKAKEEAIARMKEEGKLQEALELELADAKAKLDVYAKETVALRRDNVLNDALAGMDFRNDKSRDMARREIVEQLIQDEAGQWVHSSGTNIRDFVEGYSKSEDNSFLFRVKSNTGAGTATPAGAPDANANKSIGEMSTNEILDMARKGKLGTFGY
jgi:hypothetical protein